VKFADFTTLTRQITLPSPTDDGQALYRAALELLERAHEDKPIRLTGVSAQSLGTEEPQQLGLFSAPPPRSAKLNAALDRIAARFGSKAITTADVVESGGSSDDDDRWGRP
jgi:DNA polymerase IV